MVAYLGSHKIYKQSLHTILACSLQTEIWQCVHVLEVFLPLRPGQMEHLFRFPVTLAGITELGLGTNAWILMRQSLWSF